MEFVNGESTEEESLLYYGDPRALQGILAKGKEHTGVCLCQSWCQNLNDEGCCLKEAGEEPEGGYCTSFVLLDLSAGEVERRMFRAMGVEMP